MDVWLQQMLKGLSNPSVTIVDVSTISRPMTFEFRLPEVGADGPLQIVG